MVNIAYDIKNIVFFMLQSIHLQATTEVQTMSTPMADQGSTSGMYISLFF